MRTKGAANARVPVEAVGNIAATARSWQVATDEELLRAMAGGDTVAFDELFVRHSASVLTFLSRLVISRCDPEDLLQETFLRVLTHAKDFRPGAALRPWLFTIARNIAINALKKSKQRSDLEVQTDLADWKFSTQDDLSDPSSHLELQEQKTRLLAALQALPPPHREILVLIIFDGFSYKETATITGEPENTLRSRVFYALRKLRKLLKES
ncbi:MAG: RNA polymerase sigma factor [Planctomycetota bacterium]